ncbi:MAG: hypothetical protein M0Z99_19550 [Betaproteobacteria bacterium]|nr:hypothetical protein [Betaproteobacteria bacterium]
MTANKPKKASTRPRASVSKGGEESQKKRIIRSLFALRTLQMRRGQSPSMTVTLGEVRVAIERANERKTEIGGGTLSTGNTANFFKDIVRREQAYRDTWPSSVLRAGYIGLQVKGQKAVATPAAAPVKGPKKGRAPKGQGPCFEFVPATGSDPIGDLYQQVPAYVRPSPTGAAPVFDVQTLELPPEVRRLPREDETFLLQLIVRLRVIETHLGVVSTKGLESLIHLQMGLKLRSAEIDSLFMGSLSAKAARDASLVKSRVLVAVEAKGKSDDILKGQIADQVAELFGIFAFKDEVDAVVPMAVKLVGPSRIYVVEYAFVERGKPVQLHVESEAFYDFAPPIGGLG